MILCFMLKKNEEIAKNFICEINYARKRILSLEKLITQNWSLKINVKEACIVKNNVVITVS